MYANDKCKFQAHLKGTSELILGGIVLEKYLNEKHKNKPAPQFRFCTPGEKTSRTSKTSRKHLELVNAAADPGPRTLQHNMGMYSQNTALLHLIAETVIKY